MGGVIGNKTSGTSAKKVMDIYFYAPGLKGPPGGI